MRINRLSSSHVGNQPVRVLQHNVTLQFETTNPTFVELSKTLIKNKGLKSGIGYYINDKAIHEMVDGHYQTPFVDEHGKIHVHETFLSYVWCVCYSMLVLYDEAIAKVSQNLVSETMLHKIDTKKIDKAQELFDYAKSLIVYYSVWDKTNLPNPEEYAADDTFFIERANGLFIYAMNFILCHEFAHIEFDHIEKIKQGRNTVSDILEFEKEADLRSMELVLSGVTNNTKLSAEIGVLMGLCSMLFFKQKSETTTHPATDDRIHKLIEKVNASNADPHWGIAVLAFKLWDNQFIKNFNWPKKVQDLKELYDLIRQEIQSEKSSS
ncbi:phage exclusion protein Lit family protein [Myroides pelagicus]|uniref:Peptidase U49 n=1 Tax=Myroides pelagicus TaxID=270914 RepID=A0A7K1GP44_9FLAO|nr:phage exclusion protein Lit family protein [Myroides pelagicus]MTH30329.1 hypothetical protein [Myroides pelagicus]